jgi:hypothetical protein
MDELELRLTELAIQPMNTDSYTPVPVSELEQIEREIGGQLPEDCHWFLKRYGKCLFKTGVSCPSSSELGPIPFAFFYGAGASGDGVLANYLSYKSQFPSRVVPIGEDGLGNLYCIATTGPNRGCIYYWDHSTGWQAEAEEYGRRGQDVPDSVKYKCLEQVAPSFTAFVLRLQADED